MAKFNQKRTKEEVLQMCHDIIDYLVANPTTYSWITEFLSKNYLSSNYLHEWAKRDSDVKELYSIINQLSCDNCDRLIASGQLNPGYGKWRLLCMRNANYISENELLQNEKLRCEVDNIKSQTALNNDILIEYINDNKE